MPTTVHTTVEVRRVDLWSIFKVAFLLYATLGLIAGLFYGLIFVVLGQLGSFLGNDEIPGLGFLTGFIGVLAVPVLAIVYGVLGSIVVTIGGGLYNLATRFVGGVKIDAYLGETPAEPSRIAGADPTPPAA